MPEAAAYLGVSATTVRRWVHDGTLRGYRVGKQLRVSPADLAAIIRQEPSGQGDQNS